MLCIAEHNLTITHTHPHPHPHLHTSILPHLHSHTPILTLAQTHSHTHSHDQPLPEATPYIPDQNVETIGGAYVGEEERSFSPLRRMGESGMN